ncbi:sigma-54-dependent Fis family transcriptional regulator [Desulfotomaculum copahuensis]|uniref:sigma-54-dependent Fis family transcriptional regulator n=1 Tax=Desulfotomaculum copahuensis TaxID=1838280 RepID=UPI001FA71F77|nr:sigma-54-dependent Fis family transcriptional regulator [Desulfotomaculum copahuensis]
MSNLIAASWQRCRSAAVNPAGGICCQVHPDDRLRQIMESNKKMLAIASPIIETVYHCIQDSGFMVVLVDQEGVILKTMGDYKTLTNAGLLNFHSGADWTERSVGTNAIGTCLATGIPIQVTGAEHFCYQHHAWTCSAAPIRSPAGNILGCLDISGPYEKMHPHTLGMIVAAAQAIESQLCNELISVKSTSTRNHFTIMMDPVSQERNKNRTGFTFQDIIGKSKKIRATVNLAMRASTSSSTVLLLGESGTGKEVFAQAIHNASERRHRPFIPVNCAAMPAGLVQSELFGYNDGAFTGAKRGGQAGKFEMAEGGTIFLDEIADMPLEMQANLLRVLQEKTIMRVGGSKVIPLDVRVIAATNRDLFQEVRNGNFREDLFYRLNVITIEIPPLRAREGDLRILIEHFLGILSTRLNKSIKNISSPAMEILTQYQWPGNIRELANVIEQAINIAENDIIDAGHLPRYLTQSLINPPDEIWRIITLDQLEEKTISKTLSHFRGNISKTARALGIGRNTLYEKIKKYNINPF